MGPTLTETEIALLTWHSLVRRSVKAWDSLHLIERAHHRDARAILESCSTLDEFLDDSKRSRLHFWFFQRRQAFLRQSKMPKWSRERLNEFVIFPASNGFVSRQDCFFVSHYWQSTLDPDPDGSYLRFCQNELASRKWSYIWIDWTCAPQAPRSASEERYFRHTLETMSGLIRNCAFMYYYPTHRPRLWILYEIAEYFLTSDNTGAQTQDIRKFLQHINEMKESNVQDVIDKYNYACLNEADRSFLISWLEFLILLHKLRLDLSDIRPIMDMLTWQPSIRVYYRRMIDGFFELRKFEGIVLYQGKRYLFTPFPYWGTHRPLLESSIGSPRYVDSRTLTPWSGQVAIEKWQTICPF